MAFSIDLIPAITHFRFHDSVFAADSAQDFASVSILIKDGMLHFGMSTFSSDGDHFMRSHHAFFINNGVYFNSPSQIL